MLPRLVRGCLSAILLGLAFASSAQAASGPNGLQERLDTDHAPSQASAAPAAPLGVNGSPVLGIYQPGLPNDLSSVAALETAAGGKFAILHWYAMWGGWKRDFNEGDLKRAAGRGAVPMITWEPWAGVFSDPSWNLRAAILSGQNDVYISSWARGLAQYGQPVLLRFAHEMHDNPYPWAVGVNGNTASDYIAAWQHVHDLFVRSGARNVNWVWNPNLLTSTVSPAEYARLFDGVYPGDQYVDWGSVDVFNTGSTFTWTGPYWWSQPVWRSFDQILAAPYQALRSTTSKPLLLAEVGSAETGGSKAAWLRDALSPATVSRYPNVRAMVWFDTRKEENWSLSSSPEALASWVEAARPFMQRSGG